MPAAPKVAYLDYLDALERVDPSSGQVRLRVGLDVGKESTFVAATYDRPAAWMKAKKQDFWFAEPVLFVRRLEDGLVRKAVESMASQLGGYWLRYYRESPGAPSKIGLGTAGLDRVEEGCAVVEAVLKDGREFSILAAEPDWWRAELERRGFDCYFGPLVLFLSKLEPALARKAAKKMAETDEQLFPRYDTPRKTVRGVLDEFSSTR